MKRRLYICPESSQLEDCTARPHSWDSSFYVVLRGHEALWQRYLDAERVRLEARQAVLDAAAREPLTVEEEALIARSDALHAMDIRSVSEPHATGGIDAAEWMRRCAEIEAEARRSAESDDAPTLEGAP